MACSKHSVIEIQLLKLLVTSCDHLYKYKNQQSVSSTVAYMTQWYCNLHSSMTLQTARLNDTAACITQWYCGLHNSMILQPAWLNETAACMTQWDCGLHDSMRHYTMIDHRAENLGLNPGHDRLPYWVWAPHINRSWKEKQASLWGESLILTRSWCYMLR